MTRAAALGLAVAGALAILAATVPLAAVPALGLAVPAGLVANEATGTVWRGALRAALWNGKALGEVDVGLAAFPLLLGEARVDLAGDDWHVQTVQGSRQGIAASNGRIELPVAFLPGASATLEARQARLLFDDGRCINAAGSVVVVLQWQDARLSGLQLEGPVECAGAEGRIALANADQGPFPVQLQATVAADGSYRLYASAQPVDAMARTALLMAGFHDSPTGLGKSLEGDLLK